MQELKLSIPEPCHENWQQMTPTDQGRFCNACAKEVVDFSMMTDTEVLNYFTNLTHDKVCGRALPDQLNRTITMPKEPKKKLFWYWNYVVMFFMFFGKGNNAKAQIGIKPISTEQLVPKVIPDLNRALEGRLGGLAIVNNARVITGKIYHADGSPVPFATVEVKGSKTGMSADANGTFSIRIENSHAILKITAVGFKETEVLVAEQNTLNILLEKSSEFFGGEMVVTVGSIGYGDREDYYGPTDRLFNRRVAVITVKDEISGKPIGKATLKIKGYSDSDSALTDGKGVDKIKGIKAYDEYSIEINADGYEANSLKIYESDFNKRKESWQVLLRRKVCNGVQIQPHLNGVGEGVAIRLGGISVEPSGEVLYIVDGQISRVDEVSADEIEDYTFLQGAEATALYGSKGANGVAIITTKKQKVKNLDTVLINSFYAHGCARTSMGATTVTTTSIETKSVVIQKVSDSLKILSTKISGALKIYPNPAQKGRPINVELKLKQTGLYQIQVTDVTGRIVLQKQINATVKEFTEMIATDERWSSGMYYISIFDSKNQLINKRGFIFL